MTDQAAVAETDGLTEEEQAYLVSEETGAEQSEPIEEQSVEPAESGTEQAEQSSAEATSKPKTVPHGALHEERERRKQAEERARQFEIEAARSQERMNTFMQMLQQQEAERQAAAVRAQQKPPPDPNEDPIGAIPYMMHRLDQQEQALRQWGQWHAQSQQAQQVAQQQEQLKHQVEQVFRNDVAQARQEAADYDDAINYLKQLRAGELMGMGFDDARINAQLESDMQVVVYSAIQNQKRPAVAIYEIAKARGWQGKPKEQQGNGGQKLQQIARSQQTNKSLSGVGVGSAGVPMDAKAIANLPQKDFEAVVRKMGDRRFEEMFG